ncbi:YdcF family protein [Heyndrickxia acidicola]|uniref:YdcF family protein n=1 Tax=Heyndrickxia acidicola TaxID=209389 RepID=A0ABU6MJE8_9BACI|nr:YdcF family protein [Heyndrickxia acidicola]MED1204635.1 YdcF family protein [Heyndrickxia acidicola]
MRVRFRNVVIIAGVFLVLITLYVVWKYEQINSYGRSIKPVKSDAIIVLGAAVVGKDQPSPVLQERLTSALTLYRQHYASSFILTGGQGVGESIAEAEASQRYLESKGVPSAVMYLDNKSKNTWENLFNAKQIMQKQGMHTAIIVTDFYHQERAQLYARELGMNTSGYVGQIPPMTNPKETLREVIAITLERH